METKFLARVAELTNMNVNELAAMPYRQVINSVVLPQILYPTGQDTRGWRIGENYMNLMAEFGTKCWLRDHFTGEIMLEIALQRLSKGAVLHEAHSFKVLPQAYWKYSAMGDQPGLMTDTCWKFLQAQAHTNPKEVYQWAWQFAVDHFSFEEMYEHFATPESWQRFILFFKENKSKIQKSDFCRRIGVSGFWSKYKTWKRLN